MSGGGNAGTINNYIRINGTTSLQGESNQFSVADAGYTKRFSDTYNYIGSLPKGTIIQLVVETSSTSNPYATFLKPYLNIIAKHN